jgi:hypothetical protein
VTILTSWRAEKAVGRVGWGDGSDLGSERWRREVGCEQREIPHYAIQSVKFSAAVI